LGRIYVPQAVHIVARLPENSVGKLDRNAVVAMLTGGSDGRRPDAPQ